ncbi:hypothetical protein CR513_16906, partial [Mucuna pruriens]
MHFDNIVATYLCVSSVFHLCRKYLAINNHFVHDPMTILPRFPFHCAINILWTRLILSPPPPSCGDLLDGYLLN